MIDSEFTKCAVRARHRKKSLGIYCHLWIEHSDFANIQFDIQALTSLVKEL
jgi:hypothetical protein